MYVPGGDVRKISKIKELDVDCVVLDCEDGVALSKKAQAREEISALLSSGFSNGKSEIAVRLNSIESGMFEQDLSSIVCDKYPSTLVLPKLNTPAEAEFVSVQYMNGEGMSELTCCCFYLVCRKSKKAHMSKRCENANQFDFHIRKLSLNH